MRIYYYLCIHNEYFLLALLYYNSFSYGIVFLIYLSEILYVCIINICNALKIPPDYLLRDALEDNEVSKIRELAEPWESISPSQQEIAVVMIQAVLERKDD